MAQSQIAALFFGAAVVGSIAAQVPSLAQNPLGTDKKQVDAIQRLERLIDEGLVNPKQFQEAMPLAEFLEAVQQQLTKDERIVLQIDKAAFGADFDEVAKTPMALKAITSRWSLRRVLETAIARIKPKADYRLGPEGIVITTPQKAFYTVVYEIRDLVERSGFLRSPLFASVIGSEIKNLRDLSPSETAALVVKIFAFDRDAPRIVIQTQFIQSNEPAPRLQSEIGVSKDRLGAGVRPPAAESIQVLNGSRLVIRATGARHAEIAGWMVMFRRLNDLAVSLNARLYEVDEAFYTKVKNAKYVPRDVAEAEFLKLDENAKERESESVFALLEKQKPLVAGDEVKVDDGREAEVLTFFTAGRCLPSPDQVRKGEKGLQVFLEGVAFSASVRVSNDRRYVHVKLTEKAEELLEIRKIKQVAGAANESLDAEIPIINSTIHSQSREIPDNGTWLVPVHFRSPAAAKANKRWVLTIQARIWIEEEEQFERKGGLPDK
jgi:hypothetical protein